MKPTKPSCGCEPRLQLTGPNAWIETEACKYAAALKRIQVLENRLEALSASRRELRNELRYFATGCHQNEPNCIVESFAKCNRADCVRAKRLLA